MRHQRVEENGFKRQGFTLIELVIVLAILGIMGGLSAVAYAGYRTNMQDHTAEKALFVLQDAYLYSKTTTENEDDVFATMDSIVDGDLHGLYTIESNGETYTITYNKNDKKYVLTDGEIASADPGEEPDKGVEGLTGMVYIDMITVCRDLEGKTMEEKHEYFKAHGYIHPNNSLGNDAYRNYMFTTVYHGSWPEVPKEFSDKHGLKEGLFIQPYVELNLAENNVVVFASTSNDSKGQWYTNMISIDGVWYYGDKKYTSVTTGYDELKKILTTTWRPLV